ncbi:MAG: dihydrofolate reductase family protein [Bryobacteraceae bacterium]|nr:dihydrofolate reductase family protein [Bryobacteraceae bacterium]
MRKLIVFNNISLDGYFVDGQGDMSWARAQDPEWDAFAQENASGGGELLFGRKTYDLMSSFWPTPAAQQYFPEVAKGMNSAPKVVFSRTMDSAAWNNTKLVKGDIAAEVGKMKATPGPGMAILGSGTIVAQLAPEGLIDEYQIVVCPVALGSGRTLFEGLREKLPLRLTKTRAFGNGNVVLCYEPKG